MAKFNLSFLRGKGNSLGKGPSIASSNANTRRFSFLSRNTATQATSTTLDSFFQKGSQLRMQREAKQATLAKETDALKQQALREEIEQIHQQEADNKRVAEEQIKVTGAERSAASQNRRQAFSNFGQNLAKGAGYGAGLIGGAAVASGVATTQGLFIFLSILLFILDFFTKFNGVDFGSVVRSAPLIVQILKGAIFGAAAITLFVIYILKRPDKREFGSWVTLVCLLYTLFALTGVNTAAVVHLIFAILVLTVYLYPIVEDRAQANFAIAIMMFVDFFAFSMFGWLGGRLHIPALLFLQNRVLFPFWTMFVLVYPPNQKKSFLVKLLTVLFIVFYFFYFAAPNFVYGEFSTAMTKDQMIAGKEAVGLVWGNMKNYTISLFTKGQKGTQKVIQAAAGPYYTGVVDDNEKKPLGVYIENIKAPYPYFYYDDEVSLVADVNVNSLGEAVKVAMNCSSKDKLGEISPDYDPDSSTNFDIAESESIPVECTFAPGAFDEGVYTATFAADYNFITFAYIQKYFLDEGTRGEVQATLLKGYETNLVSHSTNGPVKITMTRSEDTSVINVKANTDTRYIFGFDIQNNLISQSGRIKQLNDVFILIPNGMEIRKEDEEYECTQRVIEATVEDCLSYCENNNKCEELCTIAFENHVAYKIDPTIFESEQRLRNIESSVTVNCDVNIPLTSRTEIIGEKPPNILEFRVITRYEYSALAESKGVEVRPKPGFNVYIEPVKATSSDPLKCVCTHTDKNINSAMYQFFSVNPDGTETPISQSKSASCDNYKRTCVGENFPRQARGSIVKCRVTAVTDDGDTPVDSKTIKIRNSPPVVEAYYEPDTPINGQILSCKGNASDADNDDVEVAYTIEGKDYDEDLTEFTMETDTVSCPNFRCAVDILPESFLPKRRFMCKLVPHDNSGEDNDWGMPSYAFAYVPVEVPVQ